VAAQLAGHRAAAELAAPVGVQDASGDLTAARDSISGGVYGEFRGHPI